jgi:hypothetical protein
LTHLKCQSRHLQQFNCASSLNPLKDAAALHPPGSPVHHGVVFFSVRLPRSKMTLAGHVVNQHF